MLLLLASLLGESLPAHAQVDSLDEVRLVDGTILLGRIKAIGDEGVQFQQAGTNLLHQIRKPEITVILLASGKSITFTDEIKPPVRDGPPADSVTATKEEPAPVGMIILASIGAILLVLLFLRAAAR